MIFNPNNEVPSPDGGFLAIEKRPYVRAFHRVRCVLQVTLYSCMADAWPIAVNYRGPVLLPKVTEEIKILAGGPWRGIVNR